MTLVGWVFSLLSKFIKEYMLYSLKQATYKKKSFSDLGYKFQLYSQQNENNGFFFVRD